MGRHLIYRTLSAGAWSLCCLSPVMAQDTGTELTFGFNQSIETDDNLDLDPVSQGRTAFASTALSFGLARETQLDRIGLTASGVLRAVDGPGAEAAFDDQRLDFGYDRTGAQSAFGFNAGYLQSDVQFLRPLEDFEDDDGQINLPPDLDDLNGTGIRESYRTGLALELGQDAPIGAALAADYLALRYTDTTDPNLTDNERLDLNADVFLRFSPLIESVLGASYRVFDDDDDEQTRRETTTGFVGLDVELSPIWRLVSRLGYTTIDTREFGTVTRTDGPSGLLRIERDMPNGTLEAGYEQTVTEDGDIRNLTIGRSLDLPTGTFAFTTEVADSELGSADFIGSLDWVQQLPRGEVNARFSRDLSFDEDNGNVLRTALFLGYIHTINTVSSINLNAGYTISKEMDQTTDRANFIAAYQHALTPDWSLSTGYRYRMREELTEPRAQSHALFFTIGREFSTRR